MSTIRPAFFYECTQSIEKEVQEFATADDSVRKTTAKSILSKLSSCSTQNSDPQLTTKICNLIELFIAKITECNKQNDYKQLKFELESLLKARLFHMPKEMLNEILQYLTVPELLRLRLVNKELKQLIDQNPVLETRINYLYLHQNQFQHDISADDLKIYLKNNGICVEINKPISLSKFNAHLSLGLRSVSSMVIREADSKGLKKVLAHLQQSFHLNELYLLDCTFDQDCFTELDALRKKHTDGKKSLKLLLCKINTVECETPTQYTQASSVLEILADSESNKCSIEKILMQEGDIKALEVFQYKVLAYELETQEVIASASSLNPWIILPIISIIWSSTIMDPQKPIPPLELRKKQGFDYIQNHPHDAAVLAAIQTYQKQIEYA